mgnify:CR=1 FL=1
METSTAIFLSMLIPTAAAAGNMVWRNQPNLRDGFTFVCAVLTFVCVLVVLDNVGSGTTIPVSMLEVFPGVELAFNVEPLGLLFAIIASGLWILTHIYGVGYMRGNDEKHHARFFACFAVAIAAVMGIAFASNMFTLFQFLSLIHI